LVSPGGGAPQLAQFRVTEEQSNRPVWWVVAQAWADAVSFQPVWFSTSDETDLEDDLEDADYGPDPVEDLPPSDPRHQEALVGLEDPIEDLPASDPRHQAALRRLHTDELALRQALGFVVYGVVPPGFREVCPGSSGPEVLSSGLRYAVVADGLTEEGSVAFLLS
jgi:hypothetical protein